MRGEVNPLRGTQIIFIFQSLFFKHIELNQQLLIIVIPATSQYDLKQSGVSLRELRH